MPRLTGDPSLPSRGRFRDVVGRGSWHGTYQTLNLTRCCRSGGLTHAVMPCRLPGEASDDPIPPLEAVRPRCRSPAGRSGGNELVSELGELSVSANMSKSGIIGYAVCDAGNRFLICPLQSEPTL